MMLRKKWVRNRKWKESEENVKKKRGMGKW